MDAWRRDVADSAAPVVIRSNDRAFRNGVPAPAQAYADDGLEFKGNKAGSSYNYDTMRSSGYSKRDRRRSSSEYGRPTRRSSFRPSSRAVGDGYIRQPEYDSYHRRGSSTKGASIWSSLFPSNRQGRSRAVTNDRPTRRTLSPEYVYTRDEPGVTVYQSRPKSQYAPARAPRKEYVVNRSGTTKSSRSRRDSFDVDNRMRLLDIRDRFREEVTRAREWQNSKPSRRRDYDRRSSYY